VRKSLKFLRYQQVAVFGQKPRITSAAKKAGRSSIRLRIYEIEVKVLKNITVIPAKAGIQSSLLKNYRKESYETGYSACAEYDGSFEKNRYQSPPLV